MKTILIVDDGAHNRAVLIAMLVHRNYRLLEAPGGEEALAIVRKENPDLVITDMFMPKMDGFEFVQKVRHDPKIAPTKIIFYTASYIEAEARRLAKEWGVEHIIFKPAEPEAVFKIVDAALGTKKTVSTSVASPDFARALLHSVADKLAEKVDELERVNATLESEILDRKRVEEELRPAQKHLQHLLAHTPAVLYVFKIEGRKVVPVLASENVERLLGVTVAEAMRYEWWVDSLHPEDRDRAIRVMAEALEGDGYSMEYRLCHTDGTYHWVEDSNRLVRNAAGEPQEMVGVWTDITERKLSEERLREQASIIERAQDAIVARDFTSDLVTVWNSGAERLYGWTASEAIGRPLGELIFDDQRDREARLEQLVAAGEYHGEIKHRAKDGREVIVDARVTLVRNDDGTPRSVLTINTDITQQKKMEKQLLRAQRLESIGTLASGVAHDLNNILVPILIATPILRGGTSPEERESFLDIIESSAQRGANIVKQVLTFARGASGDHILLQPIYLLEEIGKIVQETFPKTVRMRMSYPEDLRLVEGDPTELHQVLLNLCVNARDAMPEGGTLSLTAENFDVDEQYAAMTPGLKAGPHVLISVVDTGTGIPQHIIDKIFDPFFTTKELGKGTGLGLSSALGIIKSHRGVVNVYSANNGTTFRVLLPSVPGVFEIGEPETPVELPRGHGETILIVDDESAIRKVAKAVLSRNGYKVLAADDGPAALSLFVKQSKKIDLVLTDMVMPIMNGLMLARTLRKMDAKAKVIVSSARDADYNPSELKDIGVQECLTKPYTREALLRTVDRVLHSES
jgi:two-component system, cell cycle sensor histidine kinase and response regulator CckA